MNSFSAELKSIGHPTKIIFETDALRNFRRKSLNENILLVTSESFVKRGVVNRIIEKFPDSSIKVISNVKPNPTIENIETEFFRIRDSRPDFVIALGGGSCIDTAKAFVRLFSLPSVTSLKKVLVLPNSDLNVDPIPLIAIPTTSGTGSEVTPFATVWSNTERRKYSISGGDLLPEISILDPSLTLNLPADVTLSSGMDCVSHAFESIWNINSTVDTRTLATRSLQLSLKALPILMKMPDNQEARASMMKASLLAGLAISQTRTALAHSISYPLTSEFGLPHGLACSFTLPELIVFNAYSASQSLTVLATELGHKSIPELQRFMLDFILELRIDEILKSRNIRIDPVLKLVPRMLDSNRASNNIREIHADDLAGLLVASLQNIGITS